MPIQSKSPLVAGLMAWLCLFAVASGAHAQPPAAPTVEAALQQYFASDAADAAVLREAGFGYERLLVAESLPSEMTLAVEVELSGPHRTVRYPLKIERVEPQGTTNWRVDWAPEQAYANALVEYAGGDTLAALGDAKAWHRTERLPAFPIVVADDAFVTPFGAVEAQTGTAKDGGDEIVPPKKLVEHSQRWVGLLLEDEPGAAIIDLLVAPGASWKQVTRAMMAPASLGLFRVYLLGRADRTVVAVPSVAPIFGTQTSPERTAPLVIGMYNVKGGPGFRVRLGDAVLEAETASGCGERMSFCAATLEQFETKTAQLVGDAAASSKTKIAYVMLAATGEFEFADVLPYYPALARALGVPAGKLFVGYIRDE